MTKNRQFRFYQQTKKLPDYGRQNPADRKNFYSNLLRHHYSRSFNHALDDDFPSAAILKGGKNALWENRETER